MSHLVATQTNKNLATNAIKGVVNPFTVTYESEI